jgi:hypothetical protein
MHLEQPNNDNTHHCQSHIKGHRIIYTCHSCPDWIRILDTKDGSLITRNDKIDVFHKCTSNVPGLDVPYSPN